MSALLCCETLKRKDGSTTVRLFAQKHRLLAAALALAVVVIMLFSVLFVAAEAEHECAGEDCAICLQLAVCENALKLSVFTAVLAALAVTVPGVLSLLFVHTPGMVSAVTPVSLKVKLSD